MFAKIYYIWRLVATAIAFTLFGFGGAIIPWLAIPVIKLLPGDKQAERQCARWLVQRTFTSFTYIMKWLGILTWEVEGLEKLQRPGQLILANHPTLLDVVFLVSFVPNTACVVKSSLRHNPAMSGFIKITDYICNDGGSDLVTCVGNALQDGSSLIIFPEGTRTEPGKGLNFQRGAANIALRTETAPILVAISCTPLSLSKQHKWYQIPDSPMHFRFRVLDDYDLAPYEPIPATQGARHLTRDLQEFFTKELVTDV